MIPGKPDSGLNPTNPGNTLNPNVPQVAPAVPVVPPGGAPGREVPAVPVDRQKPPAGPLETTDKFTFPVPPPASVDPHHRDDTMLNITTSAAFAFLGGALLAAESAKALPPLSVPPALPVPSSNVRADEPEKLKDLDDAARKLDAANKRIKDLERQLDKLTEALYGRKDPAGYPIPSDPGALEEIKRLKNRIEELNNELKKFQTQTALKPAVVPPVPAKGIVKIINDYPVEISMVINEKQTYRVAPNTTLEVEIPAGEFTYQLLQSGAAATRSVIKEREVVKLRIK
jgi:hypothetical protein